MIMFSLIMLSVMFVMIPRAQASAVRINEVLNMMPEIHDPERRAMPAWSTARLNFRMSPSIIRVRRNPPFRIFPSMPGRVKSRRSSAEPAQVNRR